MIQRLVGYVAAGLLVLALLVIPAALWAGPRVEAQIAPALVAQEVPAIERARDTVCWRWTSTKTKDATPVGFAWTVSGDDGVLYSVAPWDRYERRPLRLLKAYHPPSRIVRDLCVDVPTFLRRDATIRITGSVTYLPHHGLWLLPTPIAPVEAHLPLIPFE
jgi:hypothetical protein